jgi:hypothetical protein
MLRNKPPTGFIVPAQPVERAVPPSGADWVYEIKHDGPMANNHYIIQLLRSDGGAR